VHGFVSVLSVPVPLIYSSVFVLYKEYVKAVHCHPAYLTYVLSTSWETLGWKKHKLESRLLGEISVTSDTQMTPPLWQKVKRNSKALKVKVESEKVGLKLDIQKTKIMASSPITSWEIDGETVETVSALIFPGSQITADGVCHIFCTIASFFVINEYFLVYHLNYFIVSFAIHLSSYFLRGRSKDYN